MRAILTIPLMALMVLGSHPLIWGSSPPSREASFAIDISGNAQLDAAAVVNSWPGGGNETDPYIIDGISFLPVPGGIHLDGTDRHVLIRNCSFETISAPSIYLDTTEHVIVENCTFRSVERSSIICRICDDLRIVGCTFLNGSAMDMYYIHLCAISSCTLMGSSGPFDMKLNVCSDTTVTDTVFLGTQSRACFVDWSTNVRLSRCNFTCRGSGLYANSSAIVTIDDCHLRGCGIISEEGDDLVLRNSSIINAPAQGIKVNNGRTLIMSGCDVYGSGNFGIQTFVSDTVELTGCNISRNRPYGILINGDYAKPTCDTTLTGCQLDSNGDRGLMLLTGRTVTVVNCTSSGHNTGFGVWDYQSSFFADDRFYDEKLGLSCDGSTRLVNDSFVSCGISYLHDWYYLDFQLEFDDATTVNGLPLVLVRDQDLQWSRYEGSFGQLFMFNVSNVRIENVSYSHSGDLISIYNSTGVRLTNISGEDLASGIAILNSREIIVEGSDFADADCGILCENVVETDLRNNTVVGSRVGLKTGNGELELARNNTISECETGINSAGEAVLDSNYISNCTTGIECYNRKTVSKCRIMDCGTGIVIYGSLSRTLPMVLEGNLISSRKGHGIVTCQNLDLVLHSNTLIYSSLLIRDREERFASSSVSISENNSLNGKRIVLIEDSPNTTGTNLTDPGEVILINCTGLKISGLEMGNVSCAVEILDSYDVTLSGSNFTDCYQAVFTSGSGSIIERCRFMNGTTGIYSYRDSVSVRSCIFRDLLGVGVDQYDSWWSSPESGIEDTLFLNCSIGINIHDCHSIYVSNNIFLMCRGPAIIINETYSSLVYRNCFLYNNGTNATFNPSRDQVTSTTHNPYAQSDWNQPMGPGNYWSDWNMPDDDLDGIVDIPRPIFENDLDLFPLADPGRILSQGVTSFSGRSGRDWVDLTWEDPVRMSDIQPGECVLFRSTDGTDFDRYRTIPIGVRHFNDTGLDHRLNYSYYMVGYNEYGYSDPTPTLTFDPDGEPPHAQIIRPNEGDIYLDRYVQVGWYVDWDRSGIRSIQLFLNDTLIQNASYPYSGSTLVTAGYGDNTLRLVAIDRSGNVGEDIVNFTVDPSLEPWWLYWPDGNLTNRTSIAIEVVSEDPFGITNLSYSLDEGDWNPSQGPRIVLDDLEDGAHSILVKASDRSGNPEYAEGAFKVDTLAPMIVVHSPINGSWLNTTEVVLNWSCSDLTSGIVGIEMTLNGVNVDEPSPGAMPILLSNGINEIEISVRDRANNIGRADWLLLSDTVPPSVTEFSPKGHDVPVNASVRITVSELLPTDALTLTIEGVQGSLTRDGWSYLFDPDQDLDHGTNYTVSVHGHDKAGNGLDFSWAFVTANEEVEPPVVAPRSDGFPWFIIPILMLFLAIVAILSLWARSRKRDVWDDRWE